MAKALNKIKQIELMFPHIKGKRVLINPNGRNWIATPVRWSLPFLYLEDVKEGKSGLSLMNKQIDASEIERIDILPDKTVNKNPQ